MTRISRETKAELTRAVRQRYRGSSKGEKTRILDEFVSVSGFHRKHAIRLLSRDEVMPASDSPRVGRKVYDQAVREALVVLWEAADRVCGKRLKPALPSFVDALERHGHLRLQPDVRARVLAISAASIDRLLAPIRNGAGRRTKRGNASEARRRVPVRTFADWNEPMPGFLEIDFVVHGGGSVAGSLIYTLVGTDVSSGWVECVPLVAREQSLVVEGLDVVQKQLPVPLLGIDSDNDGAFINDTLIDYCRAKEIEFTRSRPYRKNDQAWIEQKNGAVVRRLVGHDRYSGVVAGQILARLYQVSRLYTNWFQPSLKLRDKVRDGAKVKKLYHKAATPAERLLKHPKVPLSTKEQLRERQRELDPVGLLHQIRDHQAALAALGSPEEASTGPGRESLEQFLSQLPSLWRAGEARPTHRRALHKPRSWRTREDPFKSVWPEILERLQAEPDATAKSLFKDLQEEYPEQFSDGQLRTLQRRVREWRHVMAKQLVYACMNGDETKTIHIVGHEQGDTKTWAAARSPRTGDPGRPFPRRNLGKEWITPEEHESREGRQSHQGRDKALANTPPQAQSSRRRGDKPAPARFAPGDATAAPSKQREEKEETNAF